MRLLFKVQTARTVQEALERAQVHERRAVYLPTTGNSRWACLLGAVLKLIRTLERR